MNYETNPRQIWTREDLEDCWPHLNFEDWPYGEDLEVVFDMYGEPHVESH